MARRGKRLYLFDIDGTLISSGGAGGKAMRAAFTAIWRLEDGFRGVEFSGRTDRAILRDALAGAGLYDDHFEEHLRRFKRAYYRRLQGTLHTSPGSVLPGVVEFIERLREEDGVTISLGTGNFRNSAGMKLRHYGLHEHFESGGFGDRTEDRAELIAQAIRTAGRARGAHSTVIVIGDTVHDVAAAKANGAVAVAVATGTASSETLAASGADVVLDTLETAAQALLGGPV
jgi:phosphoglycolate phosphatase